MLALITFINCVIVTDAELAARKAQLGVDTSTAHSDSDVGGDTGIEHDPVQDPVILSGTVSASADALLRAGSARAGLIPVNLNAELLVDAVPAVWAVTDLTGLYAGATGTFVMASLSPPEDLRAPFTADPAAQGALYALVAWVDDDKDDTFDGGEQPIDIGITQLLAYSRAPSELAADGGLPAGYSLVSLDLATRTLSGAVKPMEQRLSLGLPGALLPRSPSTLTLELDKSSKQALADVGDTGRVALLGYEVVTEPSGYPVLIDEAFKGGGSHTVAGPFAEPADEAFAMEWADSSLNSMHVEIAPFIAVAYADVDLDGVYDASLDLMLACSCEEREPRALVFVRPDCFQGIFALPGLGSFGWMVVDDAMPMTMSPTQYTDGVWLARVHGARP